jgi:hypothetical protein
VIKVRVGAPGGSSHAREAVGTSDNRLEAWMAVTEGVAPSELDAVPWTPTPALTRHCLFEARITSSLICEKQ